MKLIPLALSLLFLTGCVSFIPERPANRTFAYGSGAMVLTACLL